MDTLHRTIKLQAIVKDNNGIEVDGLYNATTKTIFISELTSKPIGQVLTHEILHALFLDKLNGNKEIRRRLEVIIREAQKVIGKDASKFYGLSSAEEFISEILTEGKLIKELAKHKGVYNTKPNSLLSKIKNWFK